MKREILFRGFHKCKEGKEKAFFDGKWHKGKWVEGCYFVAKDKNFNILHYISEIKGEHMFEVFPETVGQYTGLTDRNGTKIFEGDIVGMSTANIIGAVKFGVYGMENDYGFYIDWTKKSNAHNNLRKDLVFWITEGVEVIGNIYDSPELLGEGEK